MTTVRLISACCALAAGFVAALIAIELLRSALG
jgi:hypothetical protein